MFPNKKVPCHIICNNLQFSNFKKENQNMYYVYVHNILKCFANHANIVKKHFNSKWRYCLAPLVLKLKSIFPFFKNQL